MLTALFFSNLSCPVSRISHSFFLVKKTSKSLQKRVKIDVICSLKLFFLLILCADRMKEKKDIFRRVDNT